MIIIMTITFAKQQNLAVTQIILCTKIKIQKNLIMHYLLFKDKIL